MKRPLAVMMNRTIRTIPPETTLNDTAKTMREVRVGALLIEERGRYIGIISETDLVRRGMAEGRDLGLTTARDIMSSPVISIEIDRTAGEASDLMSAKGLRHLAVTDGGRIIGVVSVRDLLRYYKNWGSV
ncbi:MAG TPA: CBS domain-containing protein [Nitrospiria bacterium]